MKAHHPQAQQPILSQPYTVLFTPNRCMTNERLTRMGCATRKYLFPFNFLSCAGIAHWSPPPV